MPAAGALVDVTAEQGGSAGDDGGQDLQVQPGEPFPAAFEEAGSGCADQVGHLQWWPRHLFRGERERVQGAGRGPHMALRQEDVNHGFAQVGMAEQQLDGAQVGAGFEQMSGEAMSKSVGMQRLVDPGAFGGLPAGVPDDLVSDRSVGRVMRAAWEQPDGSVLDPEGVPNYSVCPSSIPCFRLPLEQEWLRTGSGDAATETGLGGIDLPPRILDGFVIEDLRAPAGGGRSHDLYIYDRSEKLVGKISTSRIEGGEFKRLLLDRVVVLAIPVLLHDAGLRMPVRALQPVADFMCRHMCQDGLLSVRPPGSPADPVVLSAPGSGSDRRPLWGPSAPVENALRLPSRSP